MGKKLQEKKLKKQMGISDRIPASERPVVTCGSVTFADKRHPNRNSRRAKNELRETFKEQLS